MSLKELFTGFETTNKKQFRLLSMIILLAAAMLRLTGLGFSYSNDELSALARVRFDSFSALVDHGFFVDGHPGGIQVFLYYWVKMFGMGEWAVRLPFALAGVLTVYFTIRVFTRWFGENTGLLTGAFLAFLEFPLLYSQIARPYGAGLLFSMMMTWYWTRLLFDEKPEKKYAAAFALSAAACMYTHYFSFLLALIIGFSGLFIMKRDRIPYYLLAGIGSALLFSPHIYITLNHLSIGGVGLWLAKPESSWLWTHVYYIFNESASLLMLAAAILILSVWFGRKSLKLNRFHLLASIFFLLPFLTGYIYSTYVNPVLQHSVLIFSFPFLLALLFSFAGKIPAKYPAALIVSVLMLGTAQTIIGNRYFSKQHFGEFRGIARAIDNWNRQYGEKNITRAISINNPWYLDYYLDQTEGGRTTFGQYDNRGGAQLDSLAMLLDSCKTAYFIYAWTKPVPIETEDIVRSRFPWITEKADFGGLAAATLYSRGNAGKTAEPDTLYRADLNQDNPELPGICAMDSLEYSKGYDGLISAFTEKTTGTLTASVEAFSDTIIEGGVLVASFHDDEGETIHWLGAQAKLFTRPGKWGNVRLSLTLPEALPADCRMKVFFWNPQKKKLKIRNLVLTAEHSDHNSK